MVRNSIISIHWFDGKRVPSLRNEKKENLHLECEDIFQFVKFNLILEQVGDKEVHFFFAIFKG